MCSTLLRRREQSIAPWKKSPRRESEKKKLVYLGHRFIAYRSSLNVKLRSDSRPMMNAQGGKRCPGEGLRNYRLSESHTPRYMRQN